MTWGATRSQRESTAAVARVIGESMHTSAQAITGGPVAAVLAGVISVVDGIISEVTAGKIRKDQAVEWAYSLGIPNARDYPRFVVDVQAMNPAQRMAERDRQVKIHDRAKTDKAREEPTIKIATIDHLMTLDVLRLRGELPPAAPAQVLVKRFEAESPWPTRLAGGMLVAAALVLVLRSER